MTAFYDDSGQFSPDSKDNFACFGMLVIPAQYIRECNDAWWAMLDKHFTSYGLLQINGIEAKSSELHNMALRLEKNLVLNNELQKNMFAHGLDTATKVNNLIEAIWAFITKPIVLTQYLAVIANKREVWQIYRPTQFNNWMILKGLTGATREQKVSLKKLRLELESFLVKYTYEFLLQRLEYLSKDPDFTFSDAFVVGDQGSDAKVMLETQAAVQAGLGIHTSLPTIINRPWFGSSLYDPCLQIADWIAFAVRVWAEQKEYSSRIRKLLPSFRGYPDPDKLIGRGIVLCPNKECFPQLPLEEITF